MVSRLFKERVRTNETLIENRPAKRPALIRKPGTACTVCVACTLIFLERFFVSCENNGAVILISKLEVAGSIPVARSNFVQQFLI